MNLLYGYAKSCKIQFWDQLIVKLKDQTHVDTFDSLAFEEVCERVQLVLLYLIFIFSADRV